MERHKSNTDRISSNDLARTPLSLAVEKEDYLLVDKLLKDDNANVNLQDSRGRSPFSIAAARLRVDIMQLLIRNRADPHREDKDRHTGFWWFLNARHDKAFFMPIKLGLPTTATHPNSLEDLIDSLPRPNNQDSRGRTWLSWAAEFGDLLVVEAFLRIKTINVNMRDLVSSDGRNFAMTPLLWAAEKNHDKLVDLMTRNKVDLSLNHLIKDWRSFGQEKALRLVRVLLSLGDEFITERDDLQGKKPLHLAFLEENEEIVNVLIDERTPLNSRDTSGRIPLQCALDRKNKRIVNRLLSSMSKLEPVETLDWFNLKDKETTWVEISQRTTGRGFDYKVIDKIQRDMFLSEGQRRL